MPAIATLAMSSLADSRQAQINEINAKITAHYQTQHEKF